MANYDAFTFRYDKLAVWDFIVGHRYVKIISRNMSLAEVMSMLEQEMGEDFCKPVTFISLAHIGEEELAPMQELELFDFDFMR